MFGHDLFRYVDSENTGALGAKTNVEMFWSRLSVAFFERGCWIIFITSISMQFQNILLNSKDESIFH